MIFVHSVRKGVPALEEICILNFDINDGVLNRIKINVFISIFIIIIQMPI